jgi:hypothetical protein
VNDDTRIDRMVSSFAIGATRAASVGVRFLQPSDACGNDGELPEPEVERSPRCDTLPGSFLVR